MSDVRSVLKEIIAEVAELDDVEAITDQTDLFGDLGIDSMQALEIVLEIERRLGVEVSEDQLRSIRSFGDAMRIAESRGTT